MSVGIVGTAAQCYCNRCGVFYPETDFTEMARAQYRAGDENALCKDCLDRLYKHKMARDEIAGYVREDRERLLQRTRNPELEQMTGAGRLGHILHHSEFISKLEKVLGGRMVVLDGAREGDLILLRVKEQAVDFICWFSQGYLPEFSIVHFNKDRQPIKEVRGWRTVLLRLIKNGGATEEQVQKVFGEPSSPNEARFWLRHLYEYRHNRITEKDK
jgi:hypothetical protein